MFSSRKTSAPSGGVLLTKSLRLRKSANAYLNKTFGGSATNSSKWTKSFWFKRGILGYVPLLTSQTVSTSANYGIQFNADDTFAWTFSNTLYINTTQVFRDTSAWYHIVLVWDSGNATASNRAILYINGVQVSSFTVDNRSSVTTSQNAWGTSGTGYIGNNGSTNDFDGYLTDFYFIDGQTLTPSSFGSFSGTGGVWQPIKYTGTYGTNGFHLTFTNTTSTTTLGYDTSGNSNNWTTNNISLTAGNTYDSMNDVPTLTSATASNYCVLNPNNLYSTSTLPSLSNGNLDASMTVNSGIAYATIGVSSGKWYWEVTCNTGGVSYMIGISKNVFPITDWQTVNGFGYFASNGNKYTNSAGATYGATYTNGDVIGVALDMDGGTLTFYKNGTSQGTAFSSLSGTYFPSLQNPGGTSTQSFNFGQQAFKYIPPSGYVALNTYNLPTPTIAQGNLYMDATLYTGNGGVQTVTNAGSFRPDMVWIKNRNTTNDHSLNDSDRGAGQTLFPNTNVAEVSYPTYFTSFNSNGFSLALGGGIFNSSGNSFVAWQWQAGQGSNVSNTNGSITSTVSANTTAGFSIVKYTGTGANATVGHGLGAIPALLIFKNRTTASTDWPVKTNQLSTNSYLFLNSSGAAATFSSFWPNDPTSSVFSVGTDNRTNGSSNAMIAYCFATVAGFSAFGSYTGNGSATGPFVYLGFQPKYLLIKRTDSTSDWYIWDSVRNTFNTVTNTLLADSGAAETSASSVNILSNGFQCVSATVVNVSTGNYIYAAFASNPFKYANAF